MGEFYINAYIAINKQNNWYYSAECNDVFQSIISFFKQNQRYNDKVANDKARFILELIIYLGYKV